VSYAAIRPTRVEVDVAAVVHNVAAVAAHAGADAYAVVKADAYGHGVIPVARALAGAPRVAGLAVALVEEGIELRDAGIEAPVLLMGVALGDAHAEIVTRQITPMISRAEDLVRFAEIGRARGEPVAVHVKVDTGMSRLGVSLHDLDELLRDADGVAVVGLATHLACADTDDSDDLDSLTAVQLNRFEQALAVAAAAGIEPAVVHAANSAASLFFPDAAFDHIRPGLAIYGNGPRPDSVELRPVLTFASEIVQLRALEPGDSVSYGALWTAEHDAVIAVVPVGYADGYPRNLSGKAQVLVRGRRCPVVGAVCMDMILVDVTELGDAVGLGEPVVLLGKQGEQHLATAQLAQWAGISEYEVTCGVSKRVPRVYS